MRCMGELGFSMTMKSLIRLIAERCGDASRVVVALSGGVDSSLVAAAAQQSLGSKVIGVTVQSELIPQRDFTRAVELAEQIGMVHHPLLMQALENKLVRRNNEDRCYHCKKGIFELMVLEYGDDVLILDGTNADDDPDRPGLRAVGEFGVFSPLKEAGLTKAQVRVLAKQLELPSWNRPSESCLATRIPVGIPLSAKALDRVQVMESFFQNKGVETLRAYHDNLVATVTYMPEYSEIMEKNRDSFAALIKRIGLRSFVFKEWTP